MNTRRAVVWIVAALALLIALAFVIWVSTAPATGAQSLPTLTSVPRTARPTRTPVTPTPTPTSTPDYAGLYAFDATAMGGLSCSEAISNSIPGGEWSHYDDTSGTLGTQKSVILCNMNASAANCSIAFDSYATGWSAQTSGYGGCFPSVGYCDAASNWSFVNSPLASQPCTIWGIPIGAQNVDLTGFAFQLDPVYFVGPIEKNVWKINAFSGSITFASCTAESHTSFSIYCGGGGLPGVGDPPATPGPSPTPRTEGTATPPSVSEIGYCGGDCNLRTGYGTNDQYVELYRNPAMNIGSYGLRVDNASATPVCEFTYPGDTIIDGLLCTWLDEMDAPDGDPCEAFPEDGTANIVNPEGTVMVSHAFTDTVAGVSSCAVAPTYPEGVWWKDCTPSPCQLGNNMPTATPMPTATGATPTVGTPTITWTPALGAPLAQSTDTRRLEVAGTPEFIAGYYPAIGALEPPTDYDTAYAYALLEKLSASNINYMRAAFSMGQPESGKAAPYARSGVCCETDGGFKWDLTTWNQDYFDYWADVIDYAWRKGIFVQLALFDAWHTRTAETGYGLTYDFYYGTDSPGYSNNSQGVKISTDDEWVDITGDAYAYQQAWVAKVVEELGEYPNIVWEVANENWYGWEWSTEIADYITTRETAEGYDHHLVMPRDLPEHDYNKVIAGTVVPTPIPNATKAVTPTKVHGSVLSASTRVMQPVIADNDGVDSGTPAVRRGVIWGAFTGGGYADYFDSDAATPAVLADATRTMYFTQGGYTKGLVDQFGLVLDGMVNHDEYVSAGMAWVLADANHLIAYLPSGGSITLSTLPGTVNAYWFNPRDGTSQYDGGAGPGFTAPDANDWVLYIGPQTATPTPVASSTPTPSRTPSPAPTSATGWTALYTDAAVYWRDVHFVNTSLGFAVGGPDWTATGDGIVIRTEDGGANWTATNLGDGWLRGLDCKDVYTCWINGRFGRVFRTLNGGDSWSPVYAGGYAGYTYCAEWVTANTVLVCTTGSGSPSHLRATDGYTFNPITFGNTQWDADCPSASVCYSASSVARVIKSTDAGATWSTLTPGGSGRFQSVDCLDVYTCYAAGDYGKIYKTTDGGSNWTALAVPGGGTQDFWRVRMYDYDSGYAVGAGGLIYRTDDGASWYQVAAPTTAEIDDVYITDMDHYVIAAWDGKIWRYVAP